MIGFKNRFKALRYLRAGKGRGGVPGWGKGTANIVQGTPEGTPIPGAPGVEVGVPHPSRNQRRSKGIQVVTPSSTTEHHGTPLADHGTAPRHWDARDPCWNPCLSIPSWGTTAIKLYPGYTQEDTDSGSEASVSGTEAS